MSKISGRYDSWLNDYSRKICFYKHTKILTSTCPFFLPLLPLYHFCLSPSSAASSFDLLSSLILLSVCCFSVLFVLCHHCWLSPLYFYICFSFVFKLRFFSLVMYFLFYLKQIHFKVYFIIIIIIIIIIHIFSFWYIYGKKILYDVHGGSKAYY